MEPKPPMWSETEETARHNIPVTPLDAVRICSSCPREATWLRPVNGYVVGYCESCAIGWCEQYWEAIESPLAGRASELLPQLRKVTGGESHA